VLAKEAEQEAAKEACFTDNDIGSVETSSAHSGIITTIKDPES